MNNSGQHKLPRVHFENLDALRFLAAFSVFVFHFFRDIKGLYPTLELSSKFQAFLVLTNKGHLGVNFFFVLSGFLITFLILHERKHKGKFEYGKFLIRRTLRIWPLYFLIVIIGFVVFPAVFEWFSTTHSVENYMTFLANMDQIWYGLEDPHNFLTSPWSIAVEEQFYLFWGLALLVLLRIKSFKLEWLVGILYIGSFIFIYMNRSDHDALYFHTFSVCQDLLTGCLIGIMLFREAKWLNWLRDIPKWLVIMGYVLGFALIIGKNKVFAGDLIVLERFTLSLFFAFIILDQVRGTNSFFKIGKIKAFTYLGKVSYGIYMYHLVVMFLIVIFINNMGWTGYWVIFAYFFSALAFILLISIASYHGFEKRLLKLKPH